MTPITVKDLTTKAMLVDLTIRQWNYSRLDKEATESVETRFNTQAKAGRYTKFIAENEDMKEINRVLSDAYNFHITNTRPWVYKGANILPSKNYNHYTTKMREFKSMLETAVNNFVVAFPNMKQKAMHRLGSLYKEEDYPDVNEIAGKYEIKISVMPLPNANDFRVTQISDEDINAIKQQIEDQLNEANKNLLHDLWDRLYSVLEKAYETFKDSDAKFHDSKIYNIAETIDVLRRLNIDDDPKLERMCVLAEERICNLDPTDVRKDIEVRKEATVDTKALLDAMKGYCS